MMRDPKVFIIILNWNGLVDTVECLDSLAKLSYRHAETVVVDNGSIDHSPEIISRTYPQVRVIVNSENAGFCRGNNIGIRYALAQGADYVWLLNNDTVVEADTLASLVALAESSSEIGLVSPVIHYFDEVRKVQFAGSYIDTATFDIHFPENEEGTRAIFQAGPNVLLWGTALLIKKSVIEKIGLLDESFFAYWEDTDYSLRSLKGEFRNVVCSAARVYHKTRLTSAGEEAMRSRHFYYYYERNYLLLRRKELHGVLARARFYLTALAEGSLHARRCPPEFVDFSLMGLWHGIKGINGPMSDGIRMPNYLKGFLLFMSRYHPVFFADLMTLNLGNISRKALRRLRPTTD